MNFKFKHTEKIVGLFVLIAIIVLIAGGVMVAISKGIFVNKFIFHTTLSDASGLSTSTVLYFKGYEIGKVEKFEFNEYNFIDVKLAVYEKYLSKILKGCVIYRQSNPITGETSLVLLPPALSNVNTVKKNVLLKEGNKVPSLDTPEGQKMLEIGAVVKSGDSVSLIFDEAKEFFTHLRSEFKLKKDSFRSLFDKIVAFSKSLEDNKEIFDHMELLLNPKDGPVFKTVLQFTRISKRLGNTVNKIEQMMENYKKPDGLMLKMLSLNKKHLQEMVQNVNKNLVALQEMLASIKDQSPLVAELMERTRKTLESLNNNPLLKGGITKKNGSANSTQKKRMGVDQ